MPITTELTREELSKRFDINDTDGTILDNTTKLMWTSDYDGGSWSTHTDGTDMPDGTLFSEYIWNANNNPGDKVLPPVNVGHSESGNFTDDYDLKHVTIPGGGKPKKYTDWRLPTVEEMLHFQLFFREIWYDDFKGDSPDDTRGLSIEGKTFQEYGLYFWTSSLLRVAKHPSSEPVHKAWAVAATDKMDPTDKATEKAYEVLGTFKAQDMSPRAQSDAYKLLEWPALKSFPTTTSMSARLVRDVKDPEVDSSDGV